MRIRQPFPGGFWGGLLLLAAALFATPPTAMAQAAVGAKFSIASGWAGVGAAFDGTNILVALESDKSAAKVAAQLVSPGGAKIGSPIALGHDGQSCCAVGVAYDGTNYLVAWEEDQGIKNSWAPLTGYGRFVNKSGAQVGQAFTMTTAGVSFDGLKMLAFGGDKYLLTYTRLINPDNGDSSNNRYVAGRIVSPDGTMGSEFRISTGFGNGSSVAFGGTNFFVVWKEDPLDQEVRGRSVSPGGTLGQEISIHASPAGSSDLVFVSYDNTNFLVVWTDDAGSGGDVFAQRVSSSSALVGGPITITTDPGMQLAISAAFDGANHLIMWVDMKNDANGNGICDAGEGSCWDVYGQYVGKDGVLAGGKFAISTDAGNQIGGVGCYGGQCLALLSSGIVFGSGGPAQVGEVYGAFLTSQAPNTTTTTATTTTSTLPTTTSSAATTTTTISTTTTTTAPGTTAATWETKAPMPTARWGAAGGVIGGNLYVAGGTTGTNSLATLEVYDPATNTWTTRASMPTARNSIGGAVINGKFYVVGGDIAANQKLATLEVYDPATDTWTTKTPMPTPRSGPGVVAIDGQLYVAGGCRGWCAPATDVLEVYDPAADTWTTKAPMPTARGIAGVEVVNGLFYVMGGCCGSNSSDSELMAKTIEVYNPATNAWTTKTQHVAGVSGTAGAIDGKIYLAGFGTTEVYDPAADSWALSSPMLTARFAAAGGVINGALYVAGGTANGLVALATLETFTSASVMRYSDNGDGTVTDATTGLTWMRCSMGQTWTESTCTGTAGGYTWDQANAMTGAVSFAGQSDWRLPNIRELHSIVDRSRLNPTIDPTAFPNAPTSIFRSATAVPNDTFHVWSVSFSSGDNSGNNRDSAYQVRLVRAGQSHASLLNLARPTMDYLDHGDGTVTHAPTGLMWQRCVIGSTWTGTTCSDTWTIHTWDAAMALTDSFAGHADWRLPTEDELLSLPDYTKPAPAINTTIFPATRADFFWSASTFATGDASHAWMLFSNGGSVYIGGKSQSYPVRRVRTDQSPGTTTSTTVSPTTTSTIFSTTTTTLAGGASASLGAGWNLLGNGLGNSIPASSVFGDANLVSTVWKWIASSSAWAFYTPTLSDGGAAYAASKGYDLLTTIEAGEGFWVNAKSGFSVQLSGDPVPTARFADVLAGTNKLPAGWSLIAIGDNRAPGQFVNAISANPPTAGTTVATSVTTLWAWDASLSGWYFYAPSLVNAGTQAAYISSKGYLDFATADKSLGPSTGFWVNHP